MLNRRVRTVLLTGLVCTLAACTAPQPERQERTTPPAPEGPAPGAAGIGDPYYPTDGNGGYDATDYAVSVRYQPRTGRLDGDTTVTATATHTLTRFNLDLRGFTVASVEVDGQRAEFTRRGAHELVVTPARQVAEGQAFRTRVRYHGRPQSASSAQLGGNGWHRTPSGAAFVLGEPHSASYWYPVNEHPRDKAPFRLTVRVPEGWSAVSIGRQGRTTTGQGWTTTTWTEPDPVASYLTTLAVDRFTVDRRRLADGTPVLDAYAPGAEGIRGDARRVGEIIEFLSGWFGEYPATVAGGIYLGEDIGYSLETQGRPTYTRSAGLETIVHELAHQWYGNTVSVQSWADICLNECLASYSQWLWAEGKQGDDLDARYHRALDRLAEDQGFWAPRLYDMGAGNEFTGVYDKGILAIHALRRQIGEDVFGRVLREFPARHRDANASWPEFERYVGRVSGQDLREFFDAWFRGTERPGDEYLLPGSLGR
ncbi:M1 family metallopeptidase [Prauserella muralis]|uniref:Aminopeptidase N n=1 Tax=Prauserella muralis TaxID=588067 RepID=A0A2V4BKM2_9PSEU|nr:M1 family metallopeptidase [Prauserella muralis]PXY31153.1 peptidase [Prauserella muralis]TWE14552.1 peptidase M1-like protein [Prauserella muralis]